MKIKVFVSVLFVGFSLSGCGDAQSEGSKTVIKLQEQCDVLTNEDKQGRVYEAVIGKYVKKKTRMLISEGRHSTEYFSEITFVNNNRETTVYSEKMLDRERYTSILKDVIYSNINDLEFEDYTFGICAYKNVDSTYMDQIDTLTLIKQGQ